MPHDHTKPMWNVLCQIKIMIIIFPLFWNVVYWTNFNQLHVLLFCLAASGKQKRFTVVSHPKAYIRCYLNHFLSFFLAILLFRVFFLQYKFCINVNFNSKTNSHAMVLFNINMLCVTSLKSFLFFHRLISQSISIFQPISVLFFSRINWIIVQKWFIESKNYFRAFFRVWSQWKTL